MSVSRRPRAPAAAAAAAVCGACFVGDAPPVAASVTAGPAAAAAVACAGADGVLAMLASLEARKNQTLHRGFSAAFFLFLCRLCSFFSRSRARASPHCTARTTGAIVPTASIACSRGREWRRGGRVAVVLERSCTTRGNTSLGVGNLGGYFCLKMCIARPMHFFNNLCVVEKETTKKKRKLFESERFLFERSKEQEQVTTSTRCRT